MAWTTPKTWNELDTLTSADMNTYVRDNVGYAKGRPVAAASRLNRTPFNTTSTAFTDLPTATVDITTGGGSKLLVLASLTWSHSAGSVWMYATVVIDGVNVGNATYGIVPGGTSGTLSFGTALVYLSPSAVSDGPHTVKLQIRTESGTMSVSQFSMAVVEVG